MKKILIVDDSYFYRNQMSMSLINAGYEVATANDGEEGLRMVKTEKPDLVLLDGVMPKLNGLEVCRILRESESNNLMPIIMLTSTDNQEDKVTGLELGADDYIIKPFNERELLSRINNTLKRIERNRSVNPLTGLPGNAEIQREVESRIAKQVSFAVTYVDLDNFKAYNDVYGFARGDLAIKLTADILRDILTDFGGKNSFLGHVGGDDFVFVTEPETVEELCRELIALFDKRIREIFTQEDLDKGFITVKNRRGEIEDFPIMTISLAVVINTKYTFNNYLEIAEVAAEVKKVVKMKNGSNYMLDRRGQKKHAHMQN